jgi:hypothetical protein
VKAPELLDAIRADLTPDAEHNRLVPQIVAGTAPLATIGALAAEEQRIVASDTRSFLHLAARAADPATAGFFASLAQGELLVAPTLPALGLAAGLDEAALASYQPKPGCQAYPAYLAWLALNADPVEAVLAICANFAAWGTYCAALAGALRGQYGFADEACAFFDFFASPPPPALEQQAVAGIQAALDSGRSLSAARGYGALLQSYELMFWNALA